MRDAEEKVCEEVVLQMFSAVLDEWDSGYVHYVCNIFPIPANNNNGYTLAVALSVLHGN